MTINQKDQQAFIESLSNVLELTRKCGAKGYEYFVRDVLTSLYQSNLAVFKTQIKYCNPRKWSMNGFNDPNDLRKLQILLADIERLMKRNNIAVGTLFFQNNKQLHRGLKEFD